jgi:N-acetylmuramoyl-L-alanine amidase
MFKHCIFLDAGHGGREASGCYTTAPSKMWDLKKGTFHNGSIFYEGVKNREYADIIAAKLVSKGINVVKIYHPWLDTPLNKRIEVANYYHNNIQPGIFFSEHSNVSSDNNGRGFSIWTSIKQDKSDILACEFVKMYKEDLSNDITKYFIDELYILKETDMPALLAENLFFDQYDDAM